MTVERIEDLESQLASLAQNVGDLEQLIGAIRFSNVLSNPATATSLIAAIATHAALPEAHHAASIVDSVIKGSDEARNTVTTLADDAELKRALVVNEAVGFEFILIASGPATGDIKFAFTVPTGASLVWSPAPYWNTSATVAVVSAVTASGSAVSMHTATSALIYVIKGIVANGANAGNLQLQWAQDTSNGSDTTVFAGSYAIFYRLN